MYPLPCRLSARYASLGAHEERDQSRKDDLESLLYVFLDLYTGKLPWAEHVSTLQGCEMGCLAGACDGPFKESQRRRGKMFYGTIRCASLATSWPWISRRYCCRRGCQMPKTLGMRDTRAYFASAEHPHVWAGFPFRSRDLCTVSRGLLGFASMVVWLTLCRGLVLQARRKEKKETTEMKRHYFDSNFTTNDLVRTHTIMVRG